MKVLNEMICIGQEAFLKYPSLNNSGSCTGCVGDVTGTIACGLSSKYMALGIADSFREYPCIPKGNDLVIRKSNIAKPI